MQTEPLTDADRDLVAASEALLEERHVPGRHRCAAALRSTSGAVYTGINLIAGGVTDVHAEPIALADAVKAGDADIEISVAVVYEGDDANNPMQVVSACGGCRELLHSYVPNVDVAIPGDDCPMKASLAELLPASPY
jgi:cytidine deaminase